MEEQRQVGGEEGEERTDGFKGRVGGGVGISAALPDSAGASGPARVAGAINGKLISMFGGIGATDACRGCGQPRSSPPKSWWRECASARGREDTGASEHGDVGPSGACHSRRRVLQREEAGVNHGTNIASDIRLSLPQPTRVQ